MLESKVTGVESLARHREEMQLHPYSKQAGVHRKLIDPVQRDVQTTRLCRKDVRGRAGRKEIQATKNCRRRFQATRTNLRLDGKVYFIGIVNNDIRYVVQSVVEGLGGTICAEIDERLTTVITDLYQDPENQCWNFDPKDILITRDVMNTIRGTPATDQRPCADEMTGRKNSYHADQSKMAVAVSSLDRRKSLTITDLPLSRGTYMLSAARASTYHCAQPVPAMYSLQSSRTSGTQSASVTGHLPLSKLTKFSQVATQLPRSSTVRIPDFLNSAEWKSLMENVQTVNEKLSYAKELGLGITSALHFLQKYIFAYKQQENNGWLRHIKVARVGLDLAKSSSQSKTVLKKRLSLRRNQEKVKAHKRTIPDNHLSVGVNQFTAIRIENIDGRYRPLFQKFASFPRLLVDDPITVSFCDISHDHLERRNGYCYLKPATGIDVCDSGDRGRYSPRKRTENIKSDNNATGQRSPKPPASGDDAGDTGDRDRDLRRKERESSQASKENCGTFVDRTDSACNLTSAVRVDSEDRSKKCGSVVDRRKALKGNEVHSKTKAHSRLVTEIDSTRIGTHRSQEEQNQKSKAVSKFRRDKGGYCECCLEHYVSIIEHLSTPGHVKFSEESANYSDIDEILKKFPGVEEYFDKLSRSQQTKDSCRRNSDLYSKSLNGKTGNDHVKFNSEFKRYNCNADCKVSNFHNSAIFPDSAQNGGGSGSREKSSSWNIETGEDLTDLDQKITSEGRSLYVKWMKITENEECESSEIYQNEDFCDTKCTSSENISKNASKRTPYITSGTTLQSTSDRVPGVTLQSVSDRVPGVTLQRVSDRVPGVTLQNTPGNTPGKTKQSIPGSTPGMILQQAQSNTPGSSIQNAQGSTTGALSDCTQRNTQGSTTGALSDCTQRNTPGSILDPPPGNTLGLNLESGENSRFTILKDNPNVSDLGYAAETEHRETKISPVHQQATKDCQLRIECLEQPLTNQATKDCQLRIECLEQPFTNQATKDCQLRIECLEQPFTNQATKDCQLRIERLEQPFTNHSDDTNNHHSAETFSRTVAPSTRKHDLTVSPPLMPCPKFKEDRLCAGVRDAFSFKSSKSSNNYREPLQTTQNPLDLLNLNYRTTTSAASIGMSESSRGYLIPAESKYSAVGNMPQQSDYSVFDISAVSKHLVVDQMSAEECVTEPQTVPDSPRKVPVLMPQNNGLTNVIHNQLHIISLTEKEKKSVESSQIGQPELTTLTVRSNNEDQCKEITSPFLLRKIPSSPSYALFGESKRADRIRKLSSRLHIQSSPEDVDEFLLSCHRAVTKDTAHETIEHAQGLIEKYRKKFRITRKPKLLLSACEMNQHKFSVENLDLNSSKQRELRNLSMPHANETRKAKSKTKHMFTESVSRRKKLLKRKSKTKYALATVCQVQEACELVNLFEEMCNVSTKGHNSFYITRLLTDHELEAKIYSGVGTNSASKQYISSQAIYTKGEGEGHEMQRATCCEDNLLQSRSQLHQNKADKNALQERHVGVIPLLGHSPYDGDFGKHFLQYCNKTAGKDTAICGTKVSTVVNTLDEHLDIAQHQSKQQYVFNKDMHTCNDVKNNEREDNSLEHRDIKSHPDTAEGHSVWPILDEVSQFPTKALDTFHKENYIFVNRNADFCGENSEDRLSKGMSKTLFHITKHSGLPQTPPCSKLSSALSISQVETAGHPNGHSSPATLSLDKLASFKHTDIANLCGMQSNTPLKSKDDLGKMVRRDITVSQSGCRNKSTASKLKCTKHLHQEASFQDEDINHSPHQQRLPKKHGTGYDHSPHHQGLPKKHGTGYNHSPHQQGLPKKHGTGYNHSPHQQRLPKKHGTGYNHSPHQQGLPKQHETGDGLPRQHETGDGLPRQHGTGDGLPRQHETGDGLPRQHETGDNKAVQSYFKCFQKSETKILLVRTDPQR